MDIKILVIEDNQLLNKSLVAMLKKEGYLAYGALDIKRAKQLFLDEEPDIVLLDIMLPGESGYDLIPFFRAHSNCFIMMLTALGDKNSKRISYEKGADDYITKPFDLDELIYKLRVTKRRIEMHKKVICVGDISFGIETNIISCKGKSFTIQPSQINLLKMLYDKYKESTYLDKNDIDCWMNQRMSGNTRMQTLVARLRKNLSEVGSENIIIETLYGKGYELVVYKKRRENEYISY